MEATFISIHDLTPEARILYSSDSVIDILGYTPDEIVNRSCWDFFPPEELPYAQQFHQKRVSMDKAAVLAYCRVKDKQGKWVGCECCFTIVYDVMIVCTSIYMKGTNSERRALEAPIVRRIFSSSPRDPRYHMLSHISQKFVDSSKEQEHEPRAALFLNRFTRTLTTMYATRGLEDVIGIPAEAMRGRSFYYCIAQNCLQDAVKCLENAKGNDSIAYLRFWFRDPRIDDNPTHDPVDDSDEEMTTEESVDHEDGGVHLANNNSSMHSGSSNRSNAAHSDESMDVDETGPNSRTSSGDSMPNQDTHEAIFGQARHAESSMSSLGESPSSEGGPPNDIVTEPIELEAVISCTSDGLVVCLRRARPLIPHPTHRPSQSVYANGLFAAPWATEPMLPPVETRARAGFGSGFAPSLGPQGARHDSGATPVHAGGPDSSDFMSAIRDQAIFAWALTGINGSMADYGQGKPTGQSWPADGVAVWASDPKHAGEDDGGTKSSNGGSEKASSKSPMDSAAQKPCGPGPHIFGDPGLARSMTQTSGSASGTPHSR
ncbi:hypothetical protein MBLNU230_g3253t1 [Neophaeotheca triangularis]